MQEILHQLIDRYHEQTIKSATDSRDMDKGAILAAREHERDIKDRQDNIAKWIREYGVGRVKGLEPVEGYTSFAQAMARVAIKYFDDANFKDQSAVSVVKHFAHLRARFGEIYRDGGGKGDRKMQSLTSKVLWLRMPEAAPIFDGQAETAIIFLGKLLKATTWEPYKTSDEGTCKTIDDRWGWQRGVELSREILDNYWYQDFFHSHGRIYEQCSKKIEAQVAPKNLEWLEPFRYFDKFLWILGDKNRDYSLMSKADETFRKFAGPQPTVHKPHFDESLA